MSKPCPTGPIFMYLNLPNESVRILRFIMLSETKTLSKGLLLTSITKPSKLFTLSHEYKTEAKAILIIMLCIFIKDNSSLKFPTPK